MRPFPLRHALVALATLLAGCFGQADLPLGDPGPNEVRPEVKVAAAAVVSPGKAQIRLLNSSEYRNTVRDLIGLEASASLSFADRAGGYDTGAGTQVDENLFNALLTEGERLAASYMQSKLRQDFACFDPNDIADSCIEQIIARLAPRAFRKDVGPALRSELRQFFSDSAAQTQSRRMGTELLIARLLTSPHFLYRTEIGRSRTADSLRSSLDPFERASVISYALTGSMPDDLLLKDASQNRLDAARIRGHVRRLLATPQGKARVVEFFKQWLRVKKLDDMAAHPDAYPKLQSAAQGAALRDEFGAFVTSVVFAGSGTLSGVLTESHTFVNKSTAVLYGLTSASETATRVELNPFQRRGVLTLASTMAALGSVGDVTKDRPVVRGLMIKNQILCEDVGPPAGINTATAASNIAEKYPNLDDLTIREQYVAMMEQGEACGACHAKFMPLGFAFGNYDALGRHVMTRQGRPIDSTVLGLPIGDEPRSFRNAVSLISALGPAKTTSRCFTRNFLSYAAGVGKGAFVDSMAAALGPGFEKTQDIKQLFEDTLASDQLYVRTAGLGSEDAP